jgi:predicted RNA-binding Zn-ribbon protein involved in translation (DUF1610 family)
MSGAAGTGGRRIERFRVRCPRCGPQQVGVAEVRLLTGMAPSERGGVQDRYTFSCPACGDRVQRPAGPQIVSILRAAGATMLGLHRGGAAGGPEPS